MFENIFPNFWSEAEIKAQQQGETSCCIPLYACLRHKSASAPRAGTRLFRGHPEDARRAVPRRPLEHATGGLRRLPPKTIRETTEITKVTDPAVTQRTAPGASAWHTPSETQNKHRAQTRKAPRLLGQEGEQH